MAADPPVQLRRVSVNVLTDIGWIRGVLHVPALQALTDYLHVAGPVLKLTAAELPGEFGPRAFLALPRAAVHLVTPLLSDALLEPLGLIGRTVPRDVECVLPGGVLNGRMDVLVNVRVSDYLKQQTGLLLLHDAVLVPPGKPRDDPAAEGLGHAIVNLEHLIGISE
jgi:hypothetical protein